MKAKQSDRIAVYVEEAIEQLTQLEAQLLEFEKDTEGQDSNSLNEIFRGIHTIKGGADFLGLNEITALAHSAEDTLDIARRRGTIDTDEIEQLLRVADTLRQLLHDSLSTRQSNADLEPSSGSTEPRGVNLGIPNKPGLFQAPISEIQSWSESPFSLYIADAGSLPTTDERQPEALIGEIGYVIDSTDSCILFRTVLSEDLIHNYLELSPSNLYRFQKSSLAGQETSSDICLSSNEEMPQIPSANSDLPQSVDIAPSGTNRPELTQSNSIRVNVDLLDELMNLAGELVLTRNQLNQGVDIHDRNVIDIAAQRLDAVTSELQEAIMSTRMQPVSVVLGHFHRLTRDMSRKLSKSVRLVTKGDEVELDKSIIENIGDPLTHLVRNAIDHGIELPEKRVRAGKPDCGTITIGARHEAGHVVLDVADDGRGISVDKLRDEAVHKRFVDKSVADQMTEKDLLRLIFLPGFSTAEQLSDISGRGVGMDVVLTNLSRLGGTVDVETELGKGTRFKIKLPLTLTIVPSLLVSTQHETFAIPQVNLVELVRPGVGNAQRIEFVGDTALLRLRGSLLPVVRLADVLQMNDDRTTQMEFPNIVVVGAGDFQYGIMVDELTDSEEIVVKPLGAHFSNCREYAGATILGDGGAALILDVAGIAEVANLADVTDRNANSDQLLDLALNNAGDEEKLLIVENAVDEFFAVQLAYVNRIERIATANIQRAGNRNVIRHRGGIVRIFELEEGIDAAPRRDTDIAYLILFHMLGTEVGIVVGNIVDIVDAAQDIDTATCLQPGVLGSSIIMDRITLLLDLFAVVKSADSSMAANEQSHVAQMREDQQTVLVVEDSVFFQDKLRELLASMDTNVLVAEDGQAGWEFLERERSIDMVLMDVEMPRMTGLELTHRMRSDPRFASLPVVMLTSLARESDIQRGKQAGANDYLIKMDQEMVKQTVLKHLSQRMKEVA